MIKRAPVQLEDFSQRELKQLIASLEKSTSEVFYLSDFDDFIVRRHDIDMLIQKQEITEGIHRLLLEYLHKIDVSRLEFSTYSRFDYLDDPKTANNSRQLEEEELQLATAMRLADNRWIAFILFKNTECSIVRMFGDITEEQLETVIQLPLTKRVGKVYGYELEDMISYVAQSDHEYGAWESFASFLYLYKWTKGQHPERIVFKEEERVNLPKIFIWLILRIIFKGLVVETQIPKQRSSQRESSSTQHADNTNNDSEVSAKAQSQQASRNVTPSPPHQSTGRTNVVDNRPVAVNQIQPKTYPIHDKECQTEFIPVLHPLLENRLEAAASRLEAVANTAQQQLLLQQQSSRELAIDQAQLQQVLSQRQSSGNGARVAIHRDFSHPSYRTYETANNNINNLPPAQRLTTSGNLSSHYPPTSSPGGNLFRTQQRFRSVTNDSGHEERAHDDPATPQFEETRIYSPRTNAVSHIQQQQQLQQQQQQQQPQQQQQQQHYQYLQRSGYNAVGKGGHPIPVRRQPPLPQAIHRLPIGSTMRRSGGFAQMQQQQSARVQQHQNLNNTISYDDTEHILRSFESFQTPLHQNVVAVGAAQVQSEQQLLAAGVINDSTFLTQPNITEIQEAEKKYDPNCALEVLNPSQRSLKRIVKHSASNSHSNLSQSMQIPSQAMQQLKSNEAQNQSLQSPGNEPETAKAHNAANNSQLMQKMYHDLYFTLDQTGDNADLPPYFGQVFQDPRKISQRKVMIEELYELLVKNEDLRPKLRSIRSKKVSTNQDKLLYKNFIEEYSRNEQGITQLFQKLQNMAAGGSTNGPLGVGNSNTIGNVQQAVYGRDFLNIASSLNALNNIETTRSRKNLDFMQHVKHDASLVRAYKHLDAPEKPPFILSNRPLSKGLRNRPRIPLPLPIPQTDLRIRPLHTNYY